MTWLERLLSGRKAEHSPPAPLGDPERVRAVDSVLAELRPMFAADGGELRLVAVEDGWVLVELRGACAGCSSSDLSLFGAVEPRLRERLPWVRGVRAG